jgi:hypothetical protein
MKTLTIVNQLGSQYDGELANFAEAMTLGGQTARDDLGCAEAPVCSVGQDDGKADATCFLVNDLPDAPGAAAYHDRNPSTNKPRLYLAYSATTNGEWFRDPTGGGDSYTGLGYHELFEAMADEPANLFAAMNWNYKGTLYTLLAREVCDPVQGITGTLTLKDGTVVDFPDYVIPNIFFGPGPVGARFDRMGALTSAGSIAPEGYQIAAGISDEQDVFAHVVTGAKGLSPRVLARKKAKGSRTALRLEQIASMLHIKDPSKIAWV